MVEKLGAAGEVGRRHGDDAGRPGEESVEVNGGSSNGFYFCRIAAGILALLEESRRGWRGDRG